MWGFMVRRGAFIVLEGLDRSGKSTQVRRLAEYLEGGGIKTAKSGFPDRSTAVGSLIEKYLQEEEELDDAAVHVLFSANRWEVVEGLKKRLAAGETVVCDRYAFSGVAYGCAKGLSVEWCKNADRGLPAPDAVLYLDVKADVAGKRGGYGEERYEKEAFQSKVRVAFEELWREDEGMWHVIDASRSEEDVARQVCRCVLCLFECVDC